MQTSEAIPAWAPRHRQLWCAESEWILGQPLIVHDAPSSLSIRWQSHTVEKSSSILLAISSLMDALVANNRGAKPRAGRDQKVATTKVSICKSSWTEGVKPDDAQDTAEVTCDRSAMSKVASDRSEPSGTAKHVLRRGGACRTRASSMSAVPGVVARMSRRRRDWSYGVLAHSSFRGRS